MTTIYHLSVHSCLRPHKTDRGPVCIPPPEGRVSVAPKDTVAGPTPVVEPSPSRDCARPVTDIDRVCGPVRDRFEGWGVG